tara:strand:+ start:753 stop:917 length:165 start_codon:yes stop_codon:yes gene_type:complete
MEDCSAIMDSVHGMMALCFACGLIFGGIFGAWISSRALAKQLKEQIKNIEQESD